MKKVAVVTVNYNTEEQTKILLKSFDRLKIPSGTTLSIIIIDNGSEKAFQLNSKESSSNITIIREDTNTGFSGGYNRGIKEALEKGAEYVLIVNNDTVMEQNLVKNLFAAFENDEKIGVTTPKIYFAKGHEYHKDRYKKEELGKVLWFAGGGIDWNNVSTVHRGLDEVDHGQYDEAGSVEFATGCCMMFKREVLEKVGLFDERYFLYYEDADLNERIKKAGYEIYYVPAAILIHVNAASSGGAGNVLQDYFITRNQTLFGMTYAPLRTKLALLKQSFRLLFNGRAKQKQALRDFYLGRFGKGTFFDNK